MCTRRRFNKWKLQREHSFIRFFQLVDIAAILASCQMTGITVLSRYHFIDLLYSIGTTNTIPVVKSLPQGNIDFIARNYYCRNLNKLGLFLHINFSKQKY